MKKSTFIVFLLVVVIASGLFSAMNNVIKAQNRENVIYSPDKSKSAEIIQSMGTNKVLLNFHKYLLVSGGNVLSGDFNPNQIQLKWEGNNRLIITIPTNLKLNTKETTVKFFSEVVNIEYE